MRIEWVQQTVNDMQDSIPTLQIGWYDFDSIDFNGCIRERLLVNFCIETTVH